MYLFCKIHNPFFVDTFTTRVHKRKTIEIFECSAFSEMMNLMFTRFLEFCEDETIFNLFMFSLEIWNYCWEVDFLQKKKINSLKLQNSQILESL